MKSKLCLASLVTLLAACSFVVSSSAADNEATGKTEKKPAIERKHKVAKTEVFHVAPDARIRVGDNKNATLADLKIGTVVHIAYVEQNGVRTAHRISDSISTGSNGTLNVEPARKGEKHLHAVLESIDTTANTLTVGAARRR